MTSAPKWCFPSALVLARYHPQARTITLTPVRLHPQAVPGSLYEYTLSPDAELLTGHPIRTGAEAIDAATGLLDHGPALGRSQGSRARGCPSPAR